MDIIAIKDMGCGNEKVGESWQETKIFSPQTPVIKILEWAGLKKRVTLSVPDNYEKEFIDFTHDLRNIMMWLKDKEFIDFTL